MSASTDLWSSIEQALMASAWLVLMASPDAARSPWVEKEINWWLEYKSRDRLLVVLTDAGLLQHADEHVTQANRMLCDALIDLLGAALADELALDTRPGAGLLPAFALPVDVAADRP